MGGIKWHKNLELLDDTTIYQESAVTGGYQFSLLPAWSRPTRVLNELNTRRHVGRKSDLTASCSPVLPLSICFLFLMRTCGFKKKLHPARRFHELEVRITVVIRVTVFLKHQDVRTHRSCNDVVSANLPHFHKPETFTAQCHCVVTNKLLGTRLTTFRSQNKCLIRNIWILAFPAD